jgi:hypothetical protein
LLFCFTDSPTRQLHIIAQAEQASKLQQIQRQWSDQAITRTTPVLMGLFALVTLWAGDVLKDGWRPRQAAWYAKSHLTFSDALAVVRAKLWSASFETSRHDRDDVKIPRALLNRLAEAACFPA